MGNLYIRGAQCKFADIDDNWESFDDQNDKMSKLATKFNVSIARESMDDGHVRVFVILNKPGKSKCFYSGEAFAYDMSVETSDDFDSRANEFIKALNTVPEFGDFHNLEWSEPNVLYFVSS